MLHNPLQSPLVSPLRAPTEARRNMAPPVPSIPVNGTLPSLDGTAAVGGVLMFNPGSWSGYPSPTFAYQLKRGGVNIAGTSPYTVLEADYDAVLTLEVSATNSEGGPVVATSAGVTIAGAAPVNTVAPAASGGTALGDAISTTAGTWTGYPAPTITYQATRNGIAIDGETASTRNIVVADSSADMGWLVTASNAAGSPSAPSNTITAQTFTAPVIAGTPTITGLAEVGGLLTATAASVSGNPTPTRTWQWLRDGVDIPGATSITYPPVSADGGADVIVRQIETNALGFDAETSAVVAVPVYVDPIIYPLDSAGALPEAAYGISQLTASYSGPAIRVVRPSDSAELDIGFDGQGIDSADLSGFIGSETGKVSTFYDLTGNGNHATQTDNTKRGNIAVGLTINGLPSVSLGDTGEYVIPVTVSMDRRTSDVFSVTEFYQTKVQAGLYEIGPTFNGNTGVFTLSTGAIRSMPPNSNSAFKPQSAPRFYSLSSASTGVTFEQDGEVTTSAAVASSIATGGKFGAISLGGYPGRFHHGVIAFYNRVLSPAERSALKTSLDSVFNCFSTGGVLAINGDSILASSTATTLRDGIVHRVIPALSTKPKVFNFAGGGEQLVNDLSGASSTYVNDESAILSRYTSDRRVVFVFKGTNDMGVGGRTAAQVYADLQTYCAAMRAGGALVIVATLLPRTGYGSSSLSEFTTFNSSVRDNWASFADGFVDLANNPTVGFGTGAESNTALYGDGLHPTVLGGSYLVPAIAAEINRVFALP